MIRAPVRPRDLAGECVPSCSTPSLWSSCLSTPSRAGQSAPAPDRTYLACRGGASSTNSKTSAAVYLDYSKNRTTGQTMERLLELAEGSGLHAHIAMFRGEKINRTEDRAVLHVVLHLRRLRKVAALEAQAVSP